MIPYEGGDVCIEEERSDRRCTGIQRELRSPSEIENALFGVCGRWLCVKEGPTAIEDGLSQFLRDIDRRQICCAEGRHEQDELEVRHLGILNI